MKQYVLIHTQAQQHPMSTVTETERFGQLKVPRNMELSATQQQLLQHTKAGIYKENILEQQGDSNTL